jgi:MFS family permease
MLSKRPLWSHANFRRLWLARTVSGFGSEITYLALPLLAATTLDATPAQMGVLTAAGTLPNLVLGLWAGVWVDRTRRRPLMIMADLVRALVVGLVALAALLGALRFPYLVVATFISGSLGLLAGIADNALLPALLRREELAEGNAKLAQSDALVEGIGPGAASVMIQVLTAPVAIVLDAVSFLLSALLLRRIAVEEPRPSVEQRSVWHDIREGFRFVWRERVMRATVAIGVTLELTGGMTDALWLLYITRTLGLPVTVIGAFFAVGAITAFLSAAVAERLTERWSIGRVIGFGALTICAGWLVVYSAGGPPPLAITIILLGGLVGSFGNTLYNISADTMQQTVTPQHMLGRVGATEVVLAGGALPVGALIGGVLASYLDVRTTLLLAGGGRVPIIVAIIAATLWRVTNDGRRTADSDRA